MHPREQRTATGAGVISLQDARHEPSVPAVVHVSNEEDHLSDLLASPQVRQAIKPVADRLGALPDGGVFCIASAQPGEGRTLISAALALTLSEKTHKKVLLVDAHGGQPRMHQLFGVPESPGLSDCLREKRRINDATSLVGTLSVLPAGRDEGSKLLFRTSATKRFVEEAAKEYDIALIDLPPLAAGAEATAFCEWSDGTIMVVRANATRASEVSKAIEMIDRRKVMGIVLNQEQDDLPPWLERLV